MTDLRRRIALWLTRWLGRLGLIRVPYDDFEAAQGRRDAFDVDTADHPADTGIWVRTQAGLWHRSTTFDGYEHGLACDAILHAGDAIGDVQRDTTRLPDDGDGLVCHACLTYWEQADTHDTTDRR